MSTLLSLKNLLRVASSMALLALICTPVHGQWTKVPASAIPGGPMENRISPRRLLDCPTASNTIPDRSGRARVRCLRRVLNTLDMRKRDA